MRNFAKLVDSLYFINSNKAKAGLLINYLKTTPDPDRGWAIAAIAGDLHFDFFKRRVIKELITERIDPLLFDLSYDYVGEMSETVALLWSSTIERGIKKDNPDTINAVPSLHDVVTMFKTLAKKDVKPYLAALLDALSPAERWALIKLGTGGLRIGISTRFLKKILAEYAKECTPNNAVDIEQIERLWHAVEPPYCDLLAWLEGKEKRPETSHKLTFQPVMLAHPLLPSDLDKLDLADWQAEWKFDGIRAQLLRTEKGAALYSRNGDDISKSFPDLINKVLSTDLYGRFDGELLALNPDKSNICEKDNYAHIASFNQLQQRLNKKKPSKALMLEIPVGFIAYDVLDTPSCEYRGLVLKERSIALANLLQPYKHIDVYPSELLAFATTEDLLNLKTQASKLSNGYIEGIMLKNKLGKYVAGRPKNQWYKLKREPKLIDAVIMYAQRGHGKRSSYYSDFTFGCWQDGQLLPVGKAYSGFTDAELKKLDTWVRRNTLGRFGPVKEVKKALVFEVAFDAVHPSNRHKSKVALRFPRINRIRWDKPAGEADPLENLIKLIAN
ncbi:cisplatin damage response ATP-dependent DNA ligase [Glaciecola petra]|uniref:DNA ligase (ATP) n=1 Tax=Glaciecola petra TaxID=3075602 RepID=A0ABU2ZV83_9ALTE|nr:cisplatin damage response ATP-dependent DNA ligase [Aestuariibacter sp. P117]MDT0596214.1 cisplatin damage response ATP-dependent DNA ligase [Aestuariibacter sp. P117]